MKKKIVCALLGSSLIISSGAYAIVRDENVNQLQNTVNNQPRLISFYNENKFDKNLGFSLDAKGDSWIDPTDIINIFTDDPEVTYNNINDLNNNTYFLKNTKADTTDVDDKLLTKADRAYVDNELSLKANSSVIATIDTKATNAATVANNLKAVIENTNTGLASKTSSANVSTIITTQIVSGGTIFDAIGAASEEGGSIATDIAQQVTDKTGPIYNAITDGSSDAITTAVAAEGVIGSAITAATATKADKTDLDAYSTTTSLNTTFDTKADKTALDAKANINYVDVELAKKTNSDDVSTIITTQIVSGGTIFDAIGAASEEGGSIATDIAQQVTDKTGPIYNAITDGSSDAITTAVAVEGVIGSAITAATATKADKTDLDAYSTTTSLNTTFDTKADKTALDAKANTNYVDVELAKKTNSDDVSTIITTQIASGGTIFDAIGAASEEGGSIATDIAKQVTDKTGPIYDAIVGGSDDAITAAVATGGAVATSIDAKLTDATDTGIIKTALDAKAEQSTVDLNTTSLTSLNTTVNNPTGGVADNYAKINTLQTGFDTKANQSEFMIVENAVLDSGSGLATKTDDDDVEQLILEAISAPTEMDQIDGAVSIRGLIYNAVANAQGDLAEAIQKNIVDSQDGAVATAIDTKITQATNNANGIVKLELDKKAESEAFKTVQNDVNNVTTGINALNTNKADKTSLDNYTATANLPSLITNTISSGSGLQLITNEANSVVATSIATGGSIHTAIGDDTSDLSQAIDTKIQTKTSGVPIGTIVMWGTAAIPDDWLELNGQNISSERYPILKSLYGGNVPNFRGQFVRGYDPTGSVDKDGAGRAILSRQGYSTAKPTIDFKTSVNGRRNATAMTDESGDGRGKFVVGNKTKNQHSIETAPNHSHTINSGGDAETRPTNISVIYIIKAK